jgi:hypothetical protein
MGVSERTEDQVHLFHAAMMRPIAQTLEPDARVLMGHWPMILVKERGYNDCG